MDDPLEREIQQLRAMFWSDRDPEGRVFAPLSDAYRRAGEVEKALEVVSEGLERLPDFASGHLIAGRVYRDLGEGELAEEYFRNALALDEENVHALRDLGSLLLRHGETGEGSDLLAKARELEYRTGAESETAVPLPAGEGGDDADRSHPTASDRAGEDRPPPDGESPSPADRDDGAPQTRTMAEVFAAQGLRDRAVQIYRQLVEAAPHDEELAARLEELAGSGGDPGAARDAGAPSEGGPGTVGAYFRSLLAWPDTVTEPEAGALLEEGPPFESDVEVVDISALAPDPDPVGDVDVPEITALAPEPRDDLVVVEIGSLAPGGGSAAEGVGDPTSETLDALGDGPPGTEGERPESGL